MNFAKINARFKDVPIVTGKTVFTSCEYAAATGLRPRTIRERIQLLAAEGRIQKVRTRRNGRVVFGWQYISRRGKEPSE